MPPIILPLMLGLFALPVSAGEPQGGPLSLEPCINGSVSRSGLFPSQAMEDEFAAYLAWTKAQGLNRLSAFESVIDEGASSGYRFPTPSMEEQFSAYMRWVEAEGLSPFYAFIATIRH